MAVLTNSLSLTEKISLFHSREKKFPPEAAFVNLLGQENAFLDAFPTIEANNITSHEYNQVTALPTAAARLAGEGTAQSKSESVKQVAHIKIYSSMMKIDKESYELGGSGKEYVAHEMRMHMAAQDNTIAADFIYGSTTDIKKLNGVSPLMIDDANNDTLSAAVLSNILL